MPSYLAPLSGQLRTNIAVRASRTVTENSAQRHGDPTVQRGIKIRTVDVDPTTRPPHRSIVDECPARVSGNCTQAFTDDPRVARVEMDSNGTAGCGPRLHAVMNDIHQMIGMRFQVSARQLGSHAHRKRRQLRCSDQPVRPSPCLCPTRRAQAHWNRAPPPCGSMRRFRESQRTSRSAHAPKNRHYPSSPRNARSPAGCLQRLSQYSPSNCACNKPCGQDATAESPVLETKLGL